VIITSTMKIILIVPLIAVLLSAVVPHTQRAFAQVDCNATPDDPSCQSSSSPPPSDNNNPPADNSQPSQPSTQTCPDGSVIDASATCPTPPTPQTQTCPDGSVIDTSATCPPSGQNTGGSSGNPQITAPQPTKPNIVNDIAKAAIHQACAAAIAGAAPHVLGSIIPGLGHAAGIAVGGAVGDAICPK
jgi:hypothetical protein